MFKCTVPNDCIQVQPQAAASLLTALGISDPWESTGEAVSESLPTDPDNCAAGWTLGAYYAVGTTVCDATVY